MSAGRSVLFALLAAAALALAACAAAPMPTDRYYRVDSVAEVQPLDHAPTVRVEPFDAAGLYAERQLIYRRPEAQGAFEQYRHQFWIEPPGLMLGDGLRASLHKALGESRVLGRNSRTRADFIVRPRLRRLEQLIEVGQARAAYGVDFLVTDEDNDPRFVLSFDETQTTARDTPDQFVAAVGQLAAKANARLVERLAQEFGR